MTTPIRITPTLPPEAQRLVDAYEREYGSSGPGCNPAGLAAVVEFISGDKVPSAYLNEMARQLRGGSGR